MDTTQDATCFRFLDLPRELRDEVYRYTFKEVDSAYRLNILEWKSHLPSPSITAVCGQIRSESLALFQQATTSHWKNHEWIIHVNENFSCQLYRNDLLLDCGRMLKFASVRQLKFLFLPLSMGTTEYLALEVFIAESGQPKWQVTWYPSSTPASWAPDTRTMLEAQGRSLKLSLIHSQHSEELDVLNCVKVFCSLFVDGQRTGKALAADGG